MNRFKLGNVEDYRMSLLDSAREALENTFPEGNQRVTLSADNFTMGKFPESTEEERKAILGGKNLSVPIKANLTLTDTETGEVLDNRKSTLMNVPWVTNRGTVIYGGKDYGISSQLQLRPGIYTRNTASGEQEASIHSHDRGGLKISYNPQTREIYGKKRGAKIHIYPFLHALGVEDESLRELWGNDIFEVNKGKGDSRALYRAAQSLAPGDDEGEYHERIARALNEFTMNPDLVEAYYGEPRDRLDPELIMHITKDLIDLNQGRSRPFARDALFAQEVRTPSLQVRELIDRNKGKLKSKLWKLGERKDLQHFDSNIFGEAISNLLFKSGLAQPLEEYNPLEGYDLMFRITRGGEGGLKGQAIPDESRDIHPSQFGFLDSTRTPECHDNKTQVFTEDGWKFWDDTTEEDRFACRVDGSPGFYRPYKLIKEWYEGEMYGYRSQDSGPEVNYLVTPNHRMWGRPSNSEYETGYQTFYAEDIHGSEFTVTTGYSLDATQERTLYSEGRKGDSTYYKQDYRGYVYCAQVPGEFLYTRRSGGLPVWLKNSHSVGIDLRAADNIHVDSDGHMYSKMIDARTGEDTLVSSQDLYKFNIAAHEHMGEDLAFGLRGGRDFDYLDQSEIDYYSSEGSESFNPFTRLIPMLSAAAPGRAMMGAKFAVKAVPTIEREAPLVRVKHQRDYDA